MGERISVPSRKMMIAVAGFSSLTVLMKAQVPFQSFDLILVLAAHCCLNLTSFGLMLN